MKKLFLSGIALLSVAFFSACSEEETVSAQAEGQYLTERVTTMKDLPPMFSFTAIIETVTVKVKATGDAMVDITIPSTSYDFKGTVMTINEFDIHNIPVLDAGEDGVAIVNHTYTEEVDGKTVTGTLSADIEPDGDLDMDITIKYGKMPYEIKQEYDSVVD